MLLQALRSVFSDFCYYPARRFHARISVAGIPATGVLILLVVHVAAALFAPGTFPTYVRT